MRKSLLSLVLLPFLLLSCGALWQSEKKGPVELARTGMYKDAAAELEPMVASGNFDPVVVESLYYSWIRTGDYTKAREKFDVWARSNPNAGPVQLAAARANRLAGNYDQALTHLDPILNFSNVGVAAQYEKAAVLDESGKHDEAFALYKKLYDNFANGIIRATSDELPVVRAMWGLGGSNNFHDANDLLGIITKSDPRNAEAFVAWGDLLAEKYNEPEAIASYRDALKIDPNMPEAHLGLAKTLASTAPDKASAELETAMTTNPNLIGGHLLIAQQQIDTEKYDKAKQEIGKVLAVNPKSAEALSLLASIAFFQNNTADFNMYVKQVLDTNAHYSKLYDLLALSCEHLRLYKETVDFAREALKLNPQDWDAMGTLGINLVRIGQEESGRQALDQAFKGDSFITSVYNTLDVLDKLDHHFTKFDTPHFRVKLYESEVAALRPYVSDLLERAYDTLSEKYGYKPAVPVNFEMYHDHNDFEVRTFGETGFDALGVSFGRLFIMDSPTARKPDTFNWGSTLWHEFTHVITLEMTDHKVPKWLSEGLSVYEERKGFPGWGDRMKFDYLQAIKAKKLLPVEEMNDGFLHPTYPQQVFVSYYEASIICDYIEEKYGFPAIKKLLLLYKDGKTTPDAFQGALGVALPEFDTGFFAWVDGKVKDIDVKTFTDLMNSGQEAVVKGDTDKAIEILNKTVQMYPEYTEDHNAYEPLAEEYLKKGDKKAAIDILKKYVGYSDTAFKGNMKLAGLLMESGDMAGARQAFEGALYIRPMDLEEHQKFGDLLLTQKQYGPAVREFEALIALNAPDKAGTYTKLGESDFGKGDRPSAKANVMKALEIAPSYEPALELLLKVR
ncbi:MAG TPA: tetratricopeptide repeat protein [Terriglobia bacterium]